MSARSRWPERVTRHWAVQISRLCQRRIFLIPLDALAFALASSAAYVLGTGGSIQPWNLLVGGTYVPAILVLRMAAFAATGVYKSLWRYGSISDVLRIMKAMVVSTAAAAGALAWFDRTPELACVLLLDSLLALSGVMALRLAARCDAGCQRRDRAVRTLIVGAGDAGEMIVRQMLRSQESSDLPIGLLDDDPEKKGKTLHGVPVLGSCENAAEVASQVKAQAIVITAPSANSPQMRSIVEKCTACGLPIKTVPAIKEILDGRVTVNQIREVNVADLINRKTATHDKEIIGSCLEGKRVLVTGAAGSIGSGLCRMALEFEPSTLTTVDISENGLFHLHQDLAHRTGLCRLSPVVANVEDGRTVEHILQQSKPHIVFHAAAHKHVPLMEDNPEEAIRNNVRGGINVILACQMSGVQRMVNISTDKAVNPTSIMGASKRLVEMFIQDIAPRSITKLCTVRFGNVLESNGSVLPLFRQQIVRGGPVTVTHPAISRFFMTIPEAVSLVLQAAALVKGGEIFILDMGEPVKIAELAKHVITLSGFKPGEEIKIVYTGLRPGEKMYEELWEAGERPCPTSHPQIMVAEPRKALQSNLQANLRLLLHYGDTLDRARMVGVLASLLPDYVPRFAAARTKPIETSVASGHKTHERHPRKRALATVVGRRI